MEFLRLASELTGEVGKLAVDAANYANTTVNQMASTAAGGVTGLVAAGVEAVTGGDPGAAFTAVSKGVAEKTTLPTMPAQSTVGKALADVSGVVGQHMAAGQQELQYTVGDYWRTLAEEEGVGAGATVVGGIGAAIAAGAETAIDLVSRTGVPKNTGGAPRRIIAGPSAIDVDTIVAAESDRFNGATNYDLIAKHGVYKDMQGQWRKWISDDGAEINMGAFRAKNGDLNGTTQSVKAGELLDHPELFKYYPEAADMEIEVTFDPDNAGKGMYAPADNKIYVVADPARQDEMISTIIHELQHKVQNVEMLTGGTNMSWIKQNVNRPLGLTKKRREIKNKINDYYRGRTPELDPEDLEDMQIAYQALSDKNLYFLQLGEKEAYVTEGMRGQGLDSMEGAYTALMRTHGGPTNVIESAPTSMEQFLDNYPTLWGQKEVLKYIVDDPALLEKYGNAKHFGLEKARKRKRDASIEPARDAAGSTPQRFQFEKGKRVNLGGPAGMHTPTPINKTLYSEMSGDALDDIVRGTYANVADGMPLRMYVADDEVLAIGQGSNKGVHVVLRGDVVSGRRHDKPGTGVIGGSEYVTDYLGVDPIDKITITKGSKVRPLTMRLLEKYFDKEVTKSGLVFTRKQDVGSSAKAAGSTETSTSE